MIGSPATTGSGAADLFTFRSANLVTFAIAVPVLFVVTGSWVEVVAVAEFDIVLGAYEVAIVPLI